MGIETRRAGDEFPGDVPAEIILPLLTKSMAEISADGGFFDGDDRGGVRDAGYVVIIGGVRERERHVYFRTTTLCVRGFGESGRFANCVRSVHFRVTAPRSSRSARRAS